MAYLDGKRSSFPNELDNILELFNLPAAQKANAERYQELILKGNLSPTEQNELNSLTVTLQEYIIDVEKWNLFGDALINMQRFIKDEVEGYIDTKQNEMQVEIEKFTYKGLWDAIIQYQKRNIITYKGDSYFALENNKNKKPTDEPDYWAKIAEKGEKGDPSLSFGYKGEYNNSMQYQLGDGVTYAGLWYYAKKTTLGNDPTEEEYWSLQTTQAMVGGTQPPDTRITLWIDTSI